MDSEASVPGLNYVRLWFLRSLAWRRVMLGKLPQRMFEQALRFFQLLVQLK